MKLRTDIKNIVEAFKETVFFTDVIDQKQLPAFQVRALSETEVKQNGQYIVDYELQLALWDRYPEGCKTFEQVKNEAHMEVEEMKRKLRTVIDILTDSRYTFGYKRPDGNQMKYDVIPHPVTEHFVFGVLVRGRIRDTRDKNCCDETELDLSAYLKSIWQQ